MKYTMEYFRWDTEDAFNQDGHGGAHPYQGHTDNIYLEYCYYEPVPQWDVGYLLHFTKHKTTHDNVSL